MVVVEVAVVVMLVAAAAIAYLRPLGRRGDVDAFDGGREDAAGGGGGGGGGVVVVVDGVGGANTMNRPFTKVAEKKNEVPVVRIERKLHASLLFTAPSLVRSTIN